MELLQTKWKANSFSNIQSSLTHVHISVHYLYRKKEYTNKIHLGYFYAQLIAMLPPFIFSISGDIK